MKKIREMILALAVAASMAVLPASAALGAESDSFKTETVAENAAETRYEAEAADDTASGTCGDHLTWRITDR